VFSPPGRPSEIRYRPERQNLIESYVYDIGKAERTLGWRPKYSFEDMLIDYRKEMDSGRFAYLVEKRRLQMQAAQ
jgi:UDP-glucose 4-epimerase